MNIKAGNEKIADGTLRGKEIVQEDNKVKQMKDETENGVSLDRIKGKGIAEKINDTRLQQKIKLEKSKLKKKVNIESHINSKNINGEGLDGIKGKGTEERINDTRLQQRTKLIQIK